MGAPMKLGGGMGLVLVLVILVLGGDPSALLESAVGSGSSGTSPARTTAAEDRLADEMRAILASTEDVWGPLFGRAGRSYEDPTLVLFSGAVQSACGFNTSASGPFYCPGDRNLYLDLEFFGQLEQLGGPGDFARAYVVGHEVGHHVQQITGTSDQIRRLQSGARSQAEANGLQVAMELQADCLAGVWAHHANRTRSVLEPGDVDEGLRAAEAIGDDRLTRGRAAPESFTHGTSAQRRQWLRRGLESGDPDACDTLGDGGQP